MNHAQRGRKVICVGVASEVPSTPFALAAEMQITKQKIHTYESVHIQVKDTGN